MYSFPLYDQILHIFIFVPDIFNSDDNDEPNLVLNNHHNLQVQNGIEIQKMIVVYHVEQLHLVMFTRALDME